MRSIFGYAAAALVSAGLTGPVPSRAAAGPVPVYSYNYYPARFTPTRWVGSTAMQPFTTYNLFPVVYGPWYDGVGTGYYAYTPPLRYYYPASTYVNPTLTANYVPAPPSYYYNPTYQGTPPYNNVSGTTYYYSTGR